jgi:integrase
MATVEQVKRKGVETNAWRVRYRDAKHGNPKAIGCESEGEARTLAGRIDAWQVLNPGVPFPRATGGRNGAVPMVDAALAYLKDIGRTRSESTVNLQSNVVDLFMRANGGESAPLTRLSSNAIEAWDATLQAAKRAPATRRMYLSHVIAWHRWSWEHRADYPGATEPRKVERARAVVARVIAPTWAECDALIGECAASVPAYRMAWIARCTGLRAAQCAALAWSHVDLSNGTILVTSGKTAQEKAGREVPIAPILVAEMRTWTRDGDRVIPGSISGVRQSIGRAWQRAAKAGHVREDVYSATERNGRSGGCPVHALRKAFVSGLHKADADPEAVEHLVGHARGIRGIYVDPDALPLRDAVALVPAVNPPTGPRVVALAAAK